MGYRAGARAYRAAVASLTEDDLSEHYTSGLAWFHEVFAPYLKRALTALSGGAWGLSRHRAFAAGSDVDLMAHVVDAVTADGRVYAYPGDWYGFVVGSSRPSRVSFDADARGPLHCLCVPSVRDGHLADEMVDFVSRGEAALLNLNLFPTLRADHRRSAAERLAPALDRALLSISFSRGFGLTASQLGVMLVPDDHPMLARLEAQWRWLTYFHNAIAARAFMAVDLDDLARVDDLRRAWCDRWLRERGLPVVEGGSYYVRAFTPDGPVAAHLAPLVRDGVARLCLKPPAEPSEVRDLPVDG